MEQPLKRDPRALFYSHPTGELSHFAIIFLPFLSKLCAFHYLTVTHNCTNTVFKYIDILSDGIIA